MRTIGVDFGLSVTDAVLVEGGRIVATDAAAGAASADADMHAALAAALAAVGGTTGVDAVALTGGRSHTLADASVGVRVHTVEEPRAIGAGGLALADVDRALVVSCGTGTAMVAAVRGGASRHVTGTPVGGGTIAGLGSALLGVRDTAQVVALARRGRAHGVDTTLADVLGAGVGSLPPSATAVSFGRLATAEAPPDPADVAAGLVTMVAQTIGIVAVNAAGAHGFDRVVLVGRLAEIDLVRDMVAAVFRVYGRDAPLVPEGAAHATAYGAVLATR